MIYFGSDFHFGHRNVINYCNRPFSSVEEMNEALIKLWNDTVKPEDTVYFLGDFALNRRYSRDIVPRLNGTKILIPGNHDECFAFPKRNYTKYCYQYLEHGWAEVYQTHNLVLKNGRHVLLSHLPYRSEAGNLHDQRFQELKPVDKGMTLLHGHLHGRYQKLGRMIDVGYDAHGKILSEADVIALIEDKRDYIPAPLTEFYNQRQLKQ